MSRTTDKIDFRIEEPQWRKADLALLRRAARQALAAGGRNGDMTILLTDDGRVQTLNSRFRGKAQPTNVLSFPAVSPTQGYLGDIVIAYGVTAAEARSAGKTLSAHAAHLVVHGILHLLGYDHTRAREAQVMEHLETSILDRLKIANPYRCAAG